MLTVKQLVTRARTSSNKGVKYSLGGGNWQHPDRASAADSNNSCDCSCYQAYNLGLSKFTTLPGFTKFNGGWLNTDGVVNDALHSNELFYRLTKPKVGCLCVYPSHSGSHTIGHIGLVTACTYDRIDKVLHCSSGNYNKYGDAILETEASVFDIPETIFVWYKDLVTGDVYG